MEVQRVQVIASLAAAADVIPAEFIRTKDEQPGATTFRGPTPEVPVVDLQDADEAWLASLAADAAAQWGIFQVVNHGIPAAVVEELKRVGREFFELPQEEKERYAMTAPPGRGGSFEGYGSTLHKEAAEGTKKPWADFLFHTIHPPSRIDYRFWPTTPSSYRSANEEYGKYMVDTVRRILQLLSKGAGLEDESTLYEALGGDGMEMLMKINYYPPCPRPDLALGVPQHTDMSVLTLLVPNDVQGLQVFKDDRWFDVDYIPHALIIHIGDQVEIATNGKYKSVLHRTTVNKEKTRMSWPVFCSPPGEAVIGPLPHFVTGDNPERFKAKKYKDYAYCKINKLPQ